jgi:hypothetical protein
VYSSLRKNLEGSTLSDDVVNIGASRRELMENLNEVIETSLEKFSKIRASNRDRQSWGRLIVSAVSEYNKVLESVQLDDLVKRVEVLEASR